MEATVPSEGHLIGSNLDFETCAFSIEDRYLHIVIFNFFFPSSSLLSSFFLFFPSFK
jgi:hypothetical protein